MSPKWYLWSWDTRGDNDQVFEALLQTGPVRTALGGEQELMCRPTRPSVRIAGIWLLQSGCRTSTLHVKWSNRLRYLCFCLLVDLPYPPIRNVLGTSFRWTLQNHARKSTVSFFSLLYFTWMNEDDLPSILEISHDPTRQSWLINSDETFLWYSRAYLQI